MTDDAAPPRSARLVQGVIRGYQHVSAHRLSPCRYVPSCSEYAHEAVGRYGAARGGWLALRRLSRCHPLGGHGFDPVPDLDLHRSRRRAGEGAQAS